jgi:hypothetical protein
MAFQDLKKAASGAGPADPFAVSYLQLCQVSYMAPSAIPAAVAELQPLNAGGSWQCAWGPFQDQEEGNLVFVAVYNYGPGLPVLAATVIRGTDIDIDDPWGIIEQIWEDLDVTSQVNFPWANNNNVLVAQGSLDGLTLIQNLNSGGQSLQNYLSTFLTDPANNQPVLIVTGHSLGGCLTTVVAPWLQSVVNEPGTFIPIVPATFAAPTAGNAAFAQYYDSCFSYAMRYYNSLDVVPLACANLSGMETIYGPCNLTIPDAAYIALLGFEELMLLAEVSYAQPFTNNAPLTGQCNTTSDWYDELFYQHHTTTYMSLLGGTSVTAGVRMPFVARRRPARRSRLIARFGSTKSLLARLP